MTTPAWTLPSISSDSSQEMLSTPSEPSFRRSDESSLSVNPHQIFNGYASDVTFAPTGRDTPDGSTSSCSDTPPNFSEEVSFGRRMEFPFGGLNGTQEPVLLPGTDGFLLAPRGTDQDQTHLHVGWGALVNFLQNPVNVMNLPSRHPIRQFSAFLREQGGTDTHLESQDGYRRGEPAYSWTSPDNAGSYFPHLATHSEKQVPRVISAPLYARGTSHRAASAPYIFNTVSPRIPGSQGSSATASPIRTALPQQIAYNEQDDHYVFSMPDGRLYRLGSEEAKPAMNRSDSVFITFPAGTTREAREKDGARSIPAWTSTWPSSNEFLKAQVCGANCIYARGFGSKRPVLIREHFRKCNHLPGDHPMKVLSRLELDAHARQQFGERSLKRKRLDLTISTSAAAAGTTPWTTMTGSYNPGTIQTHSATAKAPYTANPVLQQFQEYRQEILIPASDASEVSAPLYQPLPSDGTPMSSLQSATLHTPATSGTSAELMDFDVMSLLATSQG